MLVEGEGTLGCANWGASRPGSILLGVSVDVETISTLAYIVEFLLSTRLKYIECPNRRVVLYAARDARTPLSLSLGFSPHSWRACLAKNDTFWGWEANDTIHCLPTYITHLPSGTERENILVTIFDTFGVGDTTFQTGGGLV